MYQVRVCDETVKANYSLTVKFVQSCSVSGNVLSANCQIHGGEFVDVILDLGIEFSFVFGKLLETGVQAINGTK